VELLVHGGVVFSLLGVLLLALTGENFVNWMHFWLSGRLARPLIDFL